MVIKSATLQGQRSRYDLHPIYIRNRHYGRALIYEGSFGAWKDCRLAEPSFDEDLFFALDSGNPAEVIRLLQRGGVSVSEALISGALDAIEKKNEKKLRAQLGALQEEAKGATERL